MNSSENAAGSLVGFLLSFPRTIQRNRSLSLPQKRRSARTSAPAMPGLSARLGIWIVVALATTVGIYAETRGGGGFLRILAIVATAALTLVILERRRWQQVRAADAAERQAIAASLTAQRERAEELERLLQF